MRATNVTDKLINTFDTIQVRGLDLTKFYSVNLHIEKITLMGKFSADLLRECKKIFEKDKVIKPFELTKDDWIMCEYEIGEILIDITLT